MNVLDIIGPVMVGPSSSHTAGAVRIGLVARELLGNQPVQAVIRLHGSFARTGKGHGTDRAIVAGLLGWLPDDERIRHSLRLASEQGLSYRFETIDLSGAHPNTAIIELMDGKGRKVAVRGASTGGGHISIESMNDLPVSFDGTYPTLVISHMDTPGVVAAVTRLLSEQRINIANMRVFRSFRGGDAVMVIEVDQQLEAMLGEQIGQVAGIRSVALIRPVLEQGGAYADLSIH